MNILDKESHALLHSLEMDLGTWIWNKILNNFYLHQGSRVNTFGKPAMSPLQGIKYRYHFPHLPHDSPQLE